MLRSVFLMLFSFILLCISLQGTDTEANSMIRDAEKLKKEKSFVKAAEKYMAASKFADSPVIQANTIQAAALCYRNAERYGKEFDCLEKLLTKYVTYIDFERAVLREYSIANDFYNGHRDVIYSWLPFIKDSDRTEEFYEAALKHGACMDMSAGARLRLGDIYLDRKDYTKSIAMYKQILSLHPESKEARYASLELIRVYLYQAKSGDGDGEWTRLAISSLKDFLARYPGDPEIPWAKKALDEASSLDAVRLYGIGRYYHRTGRDDLAQRYLVRVIRTYGATERSIPSERLLADIDKSYVPPAKDAPRTPDYEHKFERHTIPSERSSIIVVPENSDGKWLLPIRDVTPAISADSSKDVPAGKVDLNEF